MRFKPYSEFESKEDYLWYLYNDLGHSNLRLSYNYTKNGDKLFSKHIYFRDLAEMSQPDFVPRTIDSKESFLSKVQHRTIHPCELVADIDDLNLMIKEEKRVMFMDAESKAKWVQKELVKEGMFPVVYKSNKGFHLHCLNYELIKMNFEDRREWKEALLLRLGCDIQKASENTTISLEGATHWKSGLIKREVNL